MDPEEEIKVQESSEPVNNQPILQQQTESQQKQEPKSNQEPQKQVKEDEKNVEDQAKQKKEEVQKEKEQKIQLKKEDKQEPVSEEKKKNQQQIIVEKDVKVQETSKMLESSPERPISVQFSKDAIQMSDNSVTIEQTSIKISVPSSQDRGFALNKHTYYKIVGSDNHGPFEIQRRFSEFQSLRRILLERWPGCFIPFLSEKSDIKSEQLKHYHKLRNLQQFLYKIAISEFIYYKEEVQLFLRSIGMDMNQMFQTMPTLKVKDVADRFKVSFEEEVQKQSPPENATYITHFSTSLKKVINSLGDLSKKSLKLAESYDIYRNTMPKFGKVIKTYEQSLLSEYTSADHQKLIIARDSNQNIQKFKILEQSNIFYEFYYMFETETRDAQALVDIILAMQMFNIRKDELETKSKQTRLEIDQICLGYKNLKVMTSRRPKEEVITELEQKQKEYIADKHSINQLYKISEIVLATRTIRNFKKMKRNNYFKIIKMWAEKTGSITEELCDLWKFLDEEAKNQIKKC